MVWDKYISGLKININKNTKYSFLWFISFLIIELLLYVMSQPTATWKILAQDDVLSKKFSRFMACFCPRTAASSCLFPAEIFAMESNFSSKLRDFFSPIPVTKRSHEITLYVSQYRSYPVTWGQRAVCPCVAETFHLEVLAWEGWTGLFCWQRVPAAGGSGQPDRCWRQGWESVTTRGLSSAGTRAGTDWSAPTSDKSKWLTDFSCAQTVQSASSS